MKTLFLILSIGSYGSVTLGESEDGTYHLSWRNMEYTHINDQAVILVSSQEDVDKISKMLSSAMETPKGVNQSWYHRSLTIKRYDYSKKIYFYKGSKYTYVPAKKVLLLITALNDLEFN